MARARRRARRRIRPPDRHLRAVRGLPQAGAARDRGGRPAPAHRSRPPPRLEANAPHAGGEAGRRADAAPPRPRRGRARLALAESRLLRAADRARKLAVARDPRGALRARPPFRGSARGAARSRRASISTISRRPRRAGSTSRRWAGSGRRSSSASPEFAHVATASSVDPRLPPQWNALELALRFRGEPFRLSIHRHSVEIESERLELRRANGIWEVARR